MSSIEIVGYEEECNCEHCGRQLRHGIRISDGRVVGATCLDKKLTKPKVYNGKSYRSGVEKIILAAKVVQFKDAGQWLKYGINKHVITFEAA